MFKRVIILSFYVLLIVSNQLAAQFSGGTGSEVDPYQISTVEQLQELRDNTNKHFILINDIDASVTIAWNDSSGFIPIGDEILKFTGQLDGKGFVIRDLVINRADESYIGLFGFTNQAVLLNLSLKESAIKGADYVGGLAGYARESEVLNSVVDSSTVNGVNIVGGLVGGNESSNILWSFTGGSVEGKDNVGGLIGLNSFAGEIENSYSKATVDGDVGVGGLVGINTADSDNPSTIKRSYAVGTTTGTDDIGSLVGLNAGAILYSYYDSSIVSGVDGVGRGFEDGVIGLLTSEMTGLNAYTNMISFDFVDYWLLTDSYPALTWEQVDFLPTPPSAITLLSPEDEEGYFRFNYEFNWDRDKWADTYKIQISKDSEFSELVVDTILTDTVFVLQESLEYLTDYYWRVRGVNESGEGAWSNVYSFTTIKAPEVGITYVSQKTAIPGDIIKIYGAKLSGFTPTSDSTSVQIGNKVTEVVGSTYHTIEVIVPEGLTGIQDITVQYPGGSKSQATAITVLKQGEVNFGFAKKIGNGVQYLYAKLTDLNSDGKLDILALERPNRWENNLIRYLSSSSGYIRFTTAGNVAELKLADFNFDGNIDFVQTNGPSWALTIRFGNGIGGFSNRGLGDGELYSVEIFDRNTDGDFDIFGTGYFGGNGFWGLNDGYGNFQVIYNESTILDNNQKNLADLDNDGDMDFIRKGDDIYWQENIDGVEFGEVQVLVNGTDFANTINSYDICDIDGDRNIDITYSVKGDGAPGEIGWYKNDGANNFIKMELIKESADGENVIAQCADLDGDGDEDIFSYREWFENNGVGNFIEYKSFISSGSSLQAVDFDGDGDLDIFGLLGTDMIVHENLSVNLRPEVVQLISPENRSVIQGITEDSLVWADAERAQEYQLQFAEDSVFESILVDSIFITPDSTYNLEIVLEENRSYYWRVKATNSRGSSDWSEVYSFTVTGVLSIEDELLPKTFTLQQNYPNPFNPTTTISYGIPELSEVRIEVFNLLGQKVMTLVNEYKKAGWYSVVLNARSLSSGIYIYRITAGDFVQTKKLTLIK